MCSHVPCIHPCYQRGFCFISLNSFWVDNMQRLFSRGLLLIAMPAVSSIPTSPVKSTQNFYEEAVFFLSKGHLGEANDKMWKSVTFELKKIMLAVGVDVGYDDEVNRMDRMMRLLTNCVDGDNRDFKIGWVEAKNLYQDRFTCRLDPADVHARINHVIGFIEELEKMDPKSIKKKLAPFIERGIKLGNIYTTDNKYIEHGGISYNVRYQIFP